MQSNIVIVVFILTCQLIGCSSINEYPSNWESLKKDNNSQCPDISGVYYKNSVELKKMPYSGTSLNGLLGGNTHHANLPENIMYIEQSEHLITIKEMESYTDNTVIAILTRTYTCKNNMLNVSIPSNNVSGAAGPIAALLDIEKSVSLYQSNNDALIAHYKHSEKGIVFLIVLPIPLFNENKHWVKWNKISQPKIAVVK